MYYYEKRLQFPIRIRKTDPRMAKYIISQYGGPDGELGASLRYLSQKFTMPCERSKAVLNDIGSEELGHLEMVGTIVHQLLEGADPELLEASGYGNTFITRGVGIYPMDSNGVPFNAASIAVSGNPITDLNEDLAAEQKAKAVYENILDMADDPDVIAPIRFLREREIVHYQRFGEILQLLQEKQAEKNKIYFNK